MIRTAQAATSQAFYVSQPRKLTQSTPSKPCDSALHAGAPLSLGNTLRHAGPLGMPKQRALGIVSAGRSQHKTPDITIGDVWPSDSEGKTAHTLGNFLKSRHQPWYEQKDLGPLMEHLQGYWEHFNQTPLTYPEYFKAPYHVWLGNESWPAAANGEPVMSMFASLCSLMPLTQAPELWQNFGRARVRMFDRALYPVVRELGISPADVNAVTDLGCGTGRPTRLLAGAFPNALVTGIDASPYALSWAMLRADPILRDQELLPEEAVSDRVRFMRAMAEHTPLANNSQDLVVLPFVAHELPKDARCAIVKEAHRILRPKGVLAFIDHKQEGSLENLIFKKLPEASRAPMLSSGVLAGLGRALQTGADGLAKKFHDLNNTNAPEPQLREYHEELLKDTFAKFDFESAKMADVSGAQRVVFARKVD